jgi:hypothetical protein
MQIARAHRLMVVDAQSLGRHGDCFYAAIGLYQRDGVTPITVQGSDGNEHAVEFAFGCPVHTLPSYKRSEADDRAWVETHVLPLMRRRATQPKPKPTVELVDTAQSSVPEGMSGQAPEALQAPKAPETFQAPKAPNYIHLHTPLMLRNAFWLVYSAFQSPYTAVVARNPFPVKTNLFAACVADRPKMRAWLTPTPFFDLESLSVERTTTTGQPAPPIPAAISAPTAKPGEHERYNPLHVVRHVARITALRCIAFM